MDQQSLRKSVSIGSKLSSIDVSQLDNIDAIPNKAKDNVLMDGLCEEDQLYLNFLMDDSSSGSEEEDHTSPSRRISSAWSPMAHGPMMLMSASKSKRMRRLRPSNVITLSLEHISYIRPCWDLSKGRLNPRRNKIKQERKSIKKSMRKSSHKKREFAVEIDDEDDDGDDNNNNNDDWNGQENKHTATTANQQQARQQDEKESEEKDRSKFITHHAFLTVTIVVFIIMMLLMGFIELKRSNKRIVEHKIKFDVSQRSIVIFSTKLGGEMLKDRERTEKHSLLIEFARGIPANLRSDSCKCETYERELFKFNKWSKRNQSVADQWQHKNCYACLDWSMRANLRVYPSNQEDSETTSAGFQQTGDSTFYSFAQDASNQKRPVTCYNFKWQSYDVLKTPIVDCFRLSENEQWFGLGDMQSISWPLNKMNINRTSIMANLANEFEQAPGAIKSSESNNTTSFRQLEFGSMARFELFSSSGFFLGNLKSDFQPSIWISANAKQAKRRELCLSVHCVEYCGKTWSDANRLQELQHRNNLLEYQVCSGLNWRETVSRHLRRKTSELAQRYLRGVNRTSLVNVTVSPSSPNLTEALQVKQILPPTDPPTKSSQLGRHQQSISEGIGLIERTMFATSIDFIPRLDGPTLLKFVNNIVKLGLKTKSILLIDTRWQTMGGSLKLNTTLFPKNTLLFELLHDEGLKIVLTVKPYIETDLGGKDLQRLNENGRLYRKVSLLSESSEDPDLVSPRRVLNRFSPEEYKRANITRRLDFFSFQNETITIVGNQTNEAPYLHPAVVSSNLQGDYYALIDLFREENRKWMIRLIKNSEWLTREADGIHFAGAHPLTFVWDQQYRAALAKIIDDLYYNENIFIIPQWTGNFGFIQVAPRRRDWQGLQSTVESVLDLGLLGFNIIHPGTVWGDFEVVDEPSEQGSDHNATKTQEKNPSDKAAEQLELVTRWLQVSVFLPILQFKDLTPLDKHELKGQLLNLVKIRESFVVPEIKKHLAFSPLVGDAKTRRSQAESIIGDKQKQILPVYKRVWHTLDDSQSDSIVDQQFLIGNDLLVAPILNHAQRQRDIYLPSGNWRDELRQVDLGGSMWLRNYSVDLKEVAWFTRLKASR